MKIINNIIKGLAGAALLSLAACSPDDHAEINPALRPSASDIRVDIDVNQNTDTVTFTLLNEGYTPVWYFQNGTKSTVNGIKMPYLTAGTYSVEIRMYNSNGVCEGSIIKEFTINNTLLSFENQAKMIASEEGKVWQFAHDKAGHLGCGPSLDKPAEWYSAQKEEKEGKGLYDDTFTFYSDGKYVYNPGEGGDAFVNVGTSALGKAPGTEDFTVSGLTEKTGEWHLEYRGADLYLVLSNEMLLGYLPFDGLYSKPEFYIGSVSSKKLQLVATPGDGSIFWQYVLSPYSDNAGGDEPTLDGFVYDHSCNMWKDASITTETYYDPGWAGKSDDNELTSSSNQSFLVKLPRATNETWQAQNKLHTSMSCNSQNSYDFSMKLRANQDHGAVTIKLTEDGNDNNFFFTEKVKLTAGEDFVFMMPDMKGIDAAKLMLVVDFGWNPENFECTMFDMVFKEHSCDDGTVLAPPSDDPAAGINWDFSAESNLLRGAYKEPFTHYAPGWNKVETFTLKAGDNNSYTYTLPEATTDTWQAQLHLTPESPVATSAAEKYDFHCVLTSSTDIKKATVKLVSASDDNTFYFSETVALEAGEDISFSKVKLDGIDIESLKVVFDFGGCPDNTEVTVSEIIFKKSE